VVTDLSTNGTFVRWTLNTAVRSSDAIRGPSQINGVKIGHGQSRILGNGSEIAFGSLQPQVHGDALEDYRECMHGVKCNTGIERVVLNRIRVSIYGLWSRS
jgi:hypothetical protein